LPVFNYSRKSFSFIILLAKIDQLTFTNTLMGVSFLLSIFLFLFLLGGISQTQNAALETNKKSQIFEMQKYLQDYHIDNASYPTTIEIENNILFIGEEKKELKENVSEEKWKICYKFDSKIGNYAVGVELSEGNWFVLSPADLKCDESDLI
jgi:hypothetical protein